MFCDDISQPMAHWAATQTAWRTPDCHVWWEKLSCIIINLWGKQGQGVCLSLRGAQTDLARGQPVCQALIRRLLGTRHQTGARWMQEPLLLSRCCWILGEYNTSERTRELHATCDGSRSSHLLWRLMEELHLFWAFPPCYQSWLTTEIQDRDSPRESRKEQTKGHADPSKVNQSIHHRCLAWLSLWRRGLAWTQSGVEEPANMSRCSQV